MMMSSKLICPPPSFSSEGGVALPWPAPRVVPPVLLARLQVDPPLLVHQLLGTGGKEEEDNEFLQITQQRTAVVFRIYLIWISMIPGSLMCTQLSTLLSCRGTFFAMSHISSGLESVKEMRSTCKHAAAFIRGTLTCTKLSTLFSYRGTGDLLYQVL